jgi:flagellar basal-body rod protein FlgB
MDLTKIGIFSGMVGKMNWLTQRQETIATNVANSDTPGYEAQDIAAFTFGNMFKKVSLATTQPGHIQLASATNSDDAKESSALRTTWELKPDGNAVSVEREAKKAADTAADYEMVTGMYKKYVTMEKAALGQGSA